MSHDNKTCSAKRTTVTQCKTCPWRVGADPFAIPNYDPKLHVKLARTIQSGIESALPALRGEGIRTMACHYSKPGDEFPCAGWLANQLGPGNNIGVRLAVISGGMPAPEVDGPQHERFEDTICKPKRKPRATRRRR